MTPSAWSEASRLTGEEAYSWLVAASASSADPFDIHVVASIFAIALDERRETGAAFGERCGLGGAALGALCAEMFPAAAPVLLQLAGGVAPAVDAEERSVHDILLLYASCRSPLERPLAAMIARRCCAPHHLWQDLGLRERGELSRLMQTHFQPLARRNAGDMKWKKFLYRMVCSSEDFALCTAPVCSDCADFEECFGDEEGESRLARIRNAV
jgi:nitrogen fixation protein NifQ